MEIFTKLLHFLSAIVVLMVVIDHIFSVTKPSIPHWYKSIGGFLVLLIVIGWFIRGTMLILGWV